MHYGATPEEWFHFDLLGLGQYLLPVVSNPNAAISALSALKTKGKVPSRYTASREIVGIPKWTTYCATDDDLALWSAEPDYGICIKTDHLRALDLDLTDAQAVSRAIDCTRMDGIVMPIRTRADSTKCLLIFLMPGEFPKQTLQTAHGVIEFLAGGNQFIACGLHKDGARYDWRAGLPDAIPTLTPEQFRLIQAALRTVLGTADWSAGRVRRTRDHSLTGSVAIGGGVVGVVEGTTDPVAEYLDLVGWVVGHAAGRVDIRCPWVKDHSAGTDPTATSYFLAGTGGFACGHFRCLHASHAGKTDQDFLDAVGYTLVDQLEGFETVAQADGLTALLGPKTEVVVTASPIEGPRFPTCYRANGWIKPISPTLTEALRYPLFCKMRLSIDLFTQEKLIGEPGATIPWSDDDYVDLTNTLMSQRFGPQNIPHTVLRAAVSHAAKSRAFDSAINWAEGLPPWDRVPRVPHWASRYLGAEDSPYMTAVSRYWWSGHAGRVLCPGAQADAAIVLISGQGTGKTSAVRLMVPKEEWYDAVSLEERDAELTRHLCGRLIIELAELRGVASREKEGVKAWISSRRDSWRKLYKEELTPLHRRFMIVGTSNEEEFLDDTTGNRRWHPIRVGLKQDLAAIERDRDQLWAEALVLFKEEGVCWQVAHQLAEPARLEASFEDVLTDRVSEVLHDVQYGTSLATCEFLQMKPIVREVFGSDPRAWSRPNQRRIGESLRTLGYERVTKYYEGKVQKLWTLKKTLTDLLREGNEHH